MSKLQNVTEKLSISLGVLFAVAFLPATASAEVSISDNGAFSDNYVRYNVVKNVDVRQANDTTIRNDVDVTNNTGYNQAYGNTGGDVTIKTGDADANVTITNKTGANVANISGCNTCGGSGDVSIRNNGAFSDNTVYFSNEKNVSLDQRNYTNIDNNVDVDNNTGYNNASGNTGSYWWNPSHSGDVTIKTGNADADVTIKNEAGLNVAHVSGCGDCQGDADITIRDNGAYSDNTVTYFNESRKDVDQYNNSNFDNNVNVNNNTGYNGAGGDYWYPSYEKDHDNWFKKDYDKHGTYDAMKYDFDKNHDYNKYDTGKYDNHSYNFPKYQTKFYLPKFDDHKKVSYYPDHKKDYGHDYDKQYVKFYPVTYDNDHDYKKYHDYDKQNYHGFSYLKHDYDKKYDCNNDWYKYQHTDKNWYEYCDHDKKYYPVHKEYKPVKHVYNPTYKVSYKPVVVYTPVYIPVYKDYDHDKKYKKDYDKNYGYDKHVSYKPHNDKHDYVKKYDKPYVYHPKVNKNHDYDWCGCNNYFKPLSYYPHKDKDYKKYPKFYGYGHTGGDVYIHTGNADAKVNLNNLASANYLW